MSEFSKAAIVFVALIGIVFCAERSATIDRIEAQQETAATERATTETELAAVNQTINDVVKILQYENAYLKAMLSGRVEGLEVWGQGGSIGIPLPGVTLAPGESIDVEIRGYLIEPGEFEQHVPHVLTPSDAVIEIDEIPSEERETM